MPFYMALSILGVLVENTVIYGIACRMSEYVGAVNQQMVENGTAMATASG